MTRRYPSNGHTNIVTKRRHFDAQPVRGAKPLLQDDPVTCYYPGCKWTGERRELRQHGKDAHTK